MWFFDLATLVGILTILVAVIGVVLGLQIYRLHRRLDKHVREIQDVRYELVGFRHYDKNEQRAVLEEMRQHLETQVHRLTDRMLANEDRWKDVNHLLIAAMNRTVDGGDFSTTPPKPHLSQFLRSFGLREADLKLESDLVFVLTPFHEDYLETYQAIRRTCEDVGLRCLRGDEEFVKGDLLNHILSLIVKARLVIANIDGRNPNVFYELGIAHALDKQTILVASSVPDLAFDVKALKIVLFQDFEQLKIGLRQELPRALVKGAR